MKVNDGQTSLCLFYHKDTTPITITLNNTQITSEKSINVLGVIFDQKLQWSEQIASSISKSSKALNAIRLIRKFFSTKELLQFITSNFYSILYYNSEIWHINSLHSNLKQKLLASSAKAIKTCLKYCSNEYSYVKLHEMCHRATPEKYLLYKHALWTFKLFNETPIHTLEWTYLNTNIILTSRQTTFKTSTDNLRRVGLNALANRVTVINNTIPLKWFNLCYESYKIKCKEKFVS